MEKEKAGSFLPLLLELKTLKKGKSQVVAFSAFSHGKKKNTQKTCIYIYSGSILSTINKAEYFSYDFWAVMGT